MPTAAYVSAVREFLEFEAGRAPDFSALTVLVPHYAAAQGFLAGLKTALAGRVVLPPRLLTLPALAVGVPGRAAAEPDSRRLVEIYSFLRRTGRLQERQLWPAAVELAGLMRELSDNQLALPADYAEFRSRLEAAYRRRLNATLGFEARLAHELWYALQQGGRPDSGRDYAERLACLAERAALPLYHLPLPGLSAMEQGFLERYAVRQPVRGLALPLAYPERQAVLDAAWVGGEAAAAAIGPLTDDLVLYGAASLEAVAVAAELQIRRWLAEGHEAIGIVALDRVAARRLRARLERHDILVQDETGWTFSTAAVSHVLDRWFGLLQDDCYYRDLLDFLKSPFVFADLAPKVLPAAVAELELALRRAGVVEGWGRFQQLARQANLAGVEPLLERMQAARRLFTGQRLPLAEWQQRLLRAFEQLGVRRALEADWAGGQLLALLRRLQGELQGDAAPYRFAEWRRWLMLQLDQATFVDARVESPVRFTHLRAARLREFNAVLILGADAGHLPETVSPGLFNQAVRRELGLPGQAERESELQAALADVIGRTPRVAATWQAERDGEPLALSPWLETLDLYHRACFGVSLKRSPPALVEPAAETALSAAEVPAPLADRLPERVTVSGWQSLVDCPYRFYARHLLGLNELDEVAEEMDKREYGTLIHAALAKFHEDHPVLADFDRATLAADLAGAVEEAFAEAGLTSYLAEAWRLRWQRRQAAYLDWALAWERAGHRFAKAEAKTALAVGVGDAEIRLEGRLDRLDRAADGLAVLDYKTQSKASLSAKLKRPGEDVQLPCYAWLTEAVEAGFVTLDEDKVTVLAWQEGLAEAAAAEAARFQAVFAALAGGAALPAQGAGPVCDRCEMRGLCRRDHWAGQ
ncbi:ATP-dependent helicase/nuclease subunit B [Sulfuritortus calidifontis]|uniref:ATP-dependent helicase/nuclease subunit B n=1 Tax=Sulfuritortus calidifontis TaxID=1914471 RepID=A0A4R3JV69_9PROT|nr:PD-(D/E)XK nuclease family protein [Sulfuritortus calidifontis]TCS71865.1 ATP-dependent helicase/nuclease subunit B [Sulfuritortus calidifontis]